MIRFRMQKLDLVEVCLRYLPWGMQQDPSF